MMVAHVIAPIKGFRSRTCDQFQLSSGSEVIFVAVKWKRVFSYSFFIFRKKPKNNENVWEIIIPGRRVDGGAGDRVANQGSVHFRCVSIPKEWKTHFLFSFTPVQEKEIDEIIFRLAEMRNDLHLDGSYTSTFTSVPLVSQFSFI